MEDWLRQHNFAYAHFPEIVDLATVATGLGLLQSRIRFVHETPPYWDSTLWTTFPRPFLDEQSFAYATALSAWSRGESFPTWTNLIAPVIKRPMQKSLKYLRKTNDSFFHVQPIPSSLERGQSEWLQLAHDQSISKQIIAIRHLDFDGSENSPQEIVLTEKLRSNDRGILLQAVSATDRMNTRNPAIIAELGCLLEHRDDEVSAKAMRSLARLAALDESAVGTATKKLDSNVRFVALAGLAALSSLESVPDHAIPPANRGLIRALQTCDYEFVGLYASAFNRWLDDPKNHFETLLKGNSPEYLEIAMESLNNTRQQLVSLD